MQNHSTRNSAKGFTLIELLIVIAIIGILAAVAIPQFNQYRIRGYDAHSKQALHDVNLLCNAYWIDTNPLEACDLPKIKDAAYGFNQNADVVATLPPSPLDNFCASAKHNSSPNTYSIDSAAMISEGTDCTGSSGTVQTASVSPAQTFEGYDPCYEPNAGPNRPEIGAVGGKWDTEKNTWIKNWGAGWVNYKDPSYKTTAERNVSSQGVWMWVDSEGRMIRTGDHGVAIKRGTCNDVPLYLGIAREEQGRLVKRVLISPAPADGWRATCVAGRAGAGTRNARARDDCAKLTMVIDRCQVGGESTCRYDFETQTFIDENGNRWDTSEYNKLAD